MMDPTGPGLEFLAALSAFQAECPNVVKNAINPHFKNRYADLAAVRETVRPILAKHGLAFTQQTFIAQDGRFMLRTILWHAPTGQQMQSIYPVDPMKPDPQALGGALTYARRYALVTMLGVASEDDDDDGNQGSQRPQQQSQPREQDQPQGRRRRREKGAPQQQREDPQPPAGPPEWDGKTIDLGRKIERGTQAGKTWRSIVDQSWLERVQNADSAWPIERAHAIARLDEIFAEEDKRMEAEERSALQTDEPPAKEEPPPDPEPDPEPPPKEEPKRPDCYLHHPPTENLPKGGAKPHADPKKCSKCPWAVACEEHSATVRHVEGKGSK